MLQILGKTRNFSMQVIPGHATSRLSWHVFELSGGANSVESVDSDTDPGQRNFVSTSQTMSSPRRFHGNIPLRRTTNPNGIKRRLGADTSRFRGLVCHFTAARDTKQLPLLFIPAAFIYKFSHVFSNRTAYRCHIIMLCSYHVPHIPTLFPAIRYRNPG